MKSAIRLGETASSLLTAIGFVALILGIAVSGQILMADEPLQSPQSSSPPDCYCDASDCDGGDGAPCRGEEAPGCGVGDYCDDVFDCGCSDINGCICRAIL